jgi:hypothetical protein
MSKSGQSLEIHRAPRTCDEAPTLLIKSGWTAPLPHVWMKEDLADVIQDKEDLEGDNDELERNNENFEDIDEELYDTRATVLTEQD